MSAVFTQHAVERMRQRDVSQKDRGGLLETIERVASDPSELTHSADIVRVGARRGDDAFIIRAGDVRAVVTVDPADNQLIVMNVYRAGETEKLATPLELDACK